MYMVKEGPNTPLIPTPTVAQPSRSIVILRTQVWFIAGFGRSGFGCQFHPEPLYSGLASYYLFLGQYEGYPNNGLGPNQAYWQWAGVSYSNASSSLYNVNFHVNNVPSGFLWGVTLSNTTKYENTQCISIQVKNGIYTYTLSQVSGYMVSPLSGSVRVNHSNVVIQVYYVKADPPVVSAMSGYSLALFTSIAASVVVVAFTAYLFLRKKKGAQTEFYGNYSLL